MNCKVAQQRIVDDLTDRFDGEVKAHLEGCSECQRLCDDLVALERLARSLRDQNKVPAGFGTRILATAPQGRFYRFFGLRPILVSLVIVMLSFGFFWMNDGPAGRDELIVAEETAMGAVADWETVEDPGYIEVVIEDPTEGEILFHLPSVIEIRRTDLHEDFRYENTGY